MCIRDRNDIMSMFGWEVEDMEKQGLLSFVSIMPSLPTRNIKDSDIAQLVKLYVYNLFTKIEQAVSKVNARRIVIDSVSLVEIFIKDEYLAKVALMQLVEKLKEMGITSLLTSGVPETTDALSSRGLIEFVVDSIVKLDFIPVTEEFKRTLLIRKMRRTNHSTLVHPMDITKEGLKIIEVKDIDKL